MTGASRPPGQANTTSPTICQNYAFSITCRRKALSGPRSNLFVLGPTVTAFGQEHLESCPRIDRREPLSSRGASISLWEL